MKNLLRTGIVIFCLLILFSCNNKKKNSDKETPKTETTSNLKQEHLQLKQDLEIFDQEYSAMVKSFYSQINQLNSFIKDGGKDQTQLKNIVVALSEKRDVPKIDVSKEVRAENEGNIQMLERIFTTFLDIENQLKDYVESGTWQKDDRKMLYNLNAKAEELTMEYERVYNETYDKVAE